MNLKKHSGKKTATGLIFKKELQRHNRLYHTFDNPEISDQEYDMLFKELVALEEQYPELAAKGQSDTENRGRGAALFGKGKAHTAHVWTG